MRHPKAPTLSAPSARPTQIERVAAYFLRNTMTRDWLDQISLFYSQQMTQALQAFDSTPDIDGNTLLDNTIVVDLWLALAPIFGVTLASLGNSNQLTGPLPGVFS